MFRLEMVMFWLEKVKFRLEMRSLGIRLAMVMSGFSVGKVCRLSVQSAF